LLQLRKEHKARLGQPIIALHGQIAVADDASNNTKDLAKASLYVVEAANGASLIPLPTGANSKG